MFAKPLTKVSSWESRAETIHIPALTRWTFESGSVRFWALHDVALPLTLPTEAVRRRAAVLPRPGSGRADGPSLRCLDIPVGVNNGQMVGVVVRYIEARPYRMHEPFLPLALEALFDAWACRN
jgi:hypothetical protein